MAKMKELIKSVIDPIAGCDILLKLFRLFNKGRLNILYYHRVTNNEEVLYSRDKNMCVPIDSFEMQMEYLSKACVPLSESEIIDIVKGKAILPDYPVWVTFDDGYKDNYLNAYPILRKYRIPATFFVTTGFINKKTIPWDDYIAKGMLLSKSKRLNYSINGQNYDFVCNTEGSRLKAIKDLWDVFECQRISGCEYLSYLVDTCKVPIESITDLFMTWDEIKEMSDNGYAIGAHTVNHRIMSRLTSDEIEFEVLRSKAEIEHRISKRVHSFAYPHGKFTDCKFEDSVHILEKSGFLLAVTTVGGANRALSVRNNFRLKRVGTNFNDSLRFFKFKVSSGSFWQK